MRPSVKKTGVILGMGFFTMACADDSFTVLEDPWVPEYYAIEGTVKEAGNAPIAGATVDLLFIVQTADAVHDLWADCGRGVAWTIETVMSDEAGRFDASGVTGATQTAGGVSCLLAVANPPADRSLAPDTMTIQNLRLAPRSPPPDTIRIDLILSPGS